MAPPPLFLFSFFSIFFAFFPQVSSHQQCHPLAAGHSTGVNAASLGEKAPGHVLPLQCPKSCGSGALQTSPVLPSLSQQGQSPSQSLHPQQGWDPAELSLSFPIPTAQSEKHDFESHFGSKNRQGVCVTLCWSVGEQSWDFWGGKGF